MQNGVYKSTASGIAKLTSGETGWYYVRNGVYRPGASGIAKKADGSSDTWFYVSGGRYNTEYTGLARKADCSSETLFYVENGIYKKSSISSYEYQSGIYKITNGVASLQSGYGDLWVQDYGMTYVKSDELIDLFCCLKIKNTEKNYPCEVMLKLAGYASDNAVINSGNESISMIAPGDTLYCTMHIAYNGDEEPYYIGGTLYPNFFEPEDWSEEVEEASAFSLVNVSRHKNGTCSEYTGGIKCSGSYDRPVFVNVIYYKDGKIVGGHHELFQAYVSKPAKFSMTAENEPDHDSYKLFVTQRR
ncbi:MAG: hypothetical protein K5637_08385 [Lachnospiraceae bacterium]|nr:hypothetical protein [Lachnospiraceae bacterium]